MIDAKTLLTMFKQLIGNGLVGYYLAPILNLIGVTKPLQQAGINAGMSMWTLCVSLTAAQFVERWGRRPLWLLGNCGILVAFVCVTGLSVSSQSLLPVDYLLSKKRTNSLRNHREVLLIHTARVLERLSSHSCFSSLVSTPCHGLFFLIYVSRGGTQGNSIRADFNSHADLPEILPFVLRSKGMAIFVSTQAVSLAFVSTTHGLMMMTRNRVIDAFSPSALSQNQYVNPIALAAIAWKYYIVYLVVQAFFITCAYFFFVETKGLTIEEVSRLFDGPQAVDAENEAGDSKGEISLVEIAEEEQPYDGKA